MSRVAVVAAGVGGRPGESRLDLLGRNVVVVRECVRGLLAAGFAGIILMTTNPVDVLSQVAQEESGLPAGRVIGSGTVLDSARLRGMLGGALGVEARSVHAYVIGEHGDSEVAAWSAARVAGVPLADFFPWRVRPPARGASFVRAKKRLRRDRPSRATAAQPLFDS